MVSSQNGISNSNCSTVAHQAHCAEIGAESVFFLKWSTLFFVLFGIIITSVS